MATPSWPAPRKLTIDLQEVDLPGVCRQPDQVAGELLAPACIDICPPRLLKLASPDLVLAFFIIFQPAIRAKWLHAERMTLRCYSTKSNRLISLCRFRLLISCMLRTGRERAFERKVQHGDCMANFPQPASSVCMKWLRQHLISMSSSSLSPKSLETGQAPVKNGCRFASVANEYGSCIDIQAHEPA